MDFKQIISFVSALLVIFIGIVALKFLSEFDYQTRKTDPQWELVWADEFDTAGSPSEELWIYDIGDGCPQLCGWGNNELQYYTDSISNVYIKEGFLHIKILKDSIENKAYSSTRIKSKSDMLYGKVEVRLKNPTKKGTWPAVWMLPTHNKYGDWPQSGEIDIMEHVGYNPDSIFGTVHTESYNHIKRTQKGGARGIKTNESKFHNYSIIWDKSKIDFFIDEQLYFTFENEKKGSSEWPFDQNFHLIMNIAVGGNWGGSQGIADDLSGQTMTVDYVRVYKDVSPKKLF